MRTHSYFALNALTTDSKFCDPLAREVPGKTQDSRPERSLLRSPENLCHDKPLAMLLDSRTQQPDDPAAL